MTRANSVTVALIQSRALQDSRRNLERTVSRIQDAARRGAQIVCTQELFRSPYFPQTENSAHFDLAEPVPGPTTRALGELARAKNIVIVASLFEKRAAGVYHNTAVVIDADGTLKGRYRKMHIPDDPCYYEKFYFTPGDLGFQAFQTRYGKVAVLVCWDQWFPEAARLAALAGAQLLFYPTAIGGVDEDPPAVQRAQREAWETVQRAHAIANGVFVAAANRAGREGKISFWGSSFVAAPFGEVLARAGRAEETLLATCNLARIEGTRRAWPFLRDRRIDAYAGLSARLLESAVSPPARRLRRRAMSPAV